VHILGKPASPLTISATEMLKKMLDGPADAARLEQAFRHLAKWRSELISNTLVERSGTTVLSGPFKGMNYAVRASEGSRASRLLGAYEASLAPVIEEIVTKGYPVVVDVGSAEGYYAVGLARRMRSARILARDANPKAQELCRALAAANDVADRVEIGGLMDHADFDICLKQRTLVVCDIEGAEAELLDPVAAPGLRQADILVECHDCMRQGLSHLLVERFKATHTIRLLGRRLDDSGLPDWMESLSDLDRLVALWEWRGGPTPWLWMVKK
jgi:Met-10+ like-protein